MAIEKLERMYARALAIQHGQANGHWLPIVRALALRGHPGGMLELACWLTESETGRDDTAFRLSRLAYLRGHAHGAQHIARNCFNARNLTGYRHWLHKAARAGDDDSAHELRRFETRLSHASAFAIGRGRPCRKHESLSQRRPY